MIQAVIFDCFGVLYADSKTVMLDMCKSEPQRQAAQDLYQAADRGYVSAPEFIDQLAKMVGVTTERLQEMITQTQIRHDKVYEYAQSLKQRGFRIAVLSNFGRDAIGRLFSEEEQEHLFDTIVASGDIGTTKPHPNAYEYILRQLDLRANEVIMIDDAASNIEGAKAVGMQGVVFTGLESCKQEVEEIISRA